MTLELTGGRPDDDGPAGHVARFLLAADARDGDARDGDACRAELHEVSRGRPTALPSRRVDVAEALSVTPQTVGKWKRRFLERRLDGLFDEPRVGRPRTLSDEDVQRVVDTTLHEKPRASTHWSTRTLAKQLGLSA